MKIENLELKLRGPQIGLSLFGNGQYLFSYLSLGDCVADLIYYFNLEEFDGIFNDFKNFGNAHDITPPYKYRGVCSELFDPIDCISRYVFYANTMSDLLERFEGQEWRAIHHPDLFTFGVQGCSIYLFDKTKNKYEYWLGGEMKSVADVIARAKKEHKLIPDAVLSEYKAPDQIDVFISHKSCDFKYAKEVYDMLVHEGYSVFLSEISLPAIANADYAHEIDNALEKSEHIVVIATSLENVLSGWVNYEWGSFANEKRSGRKTGNLVTLIKDMQIEQLPYLLRQYEVVPYENLKQLKSMLPKI